MEISRKEFLGAVTRGAAGVAAVSALAPEPAAAGQAQAAPVTKKV